MLKQTIDSFYELLPNAYRVADKVASVLNHAEILREVFPDFSNLSVVNTVLEGFTPKICVTDSTHTYILKFAKQKGNTLIRDYVTEFLGSNLAQALGYKVQNVALGRFNGNECCAIEMFDKAIVTFDGMGSSTKDSDFVYDLDTLLSFPFEPSKFSTNVENYVRYVWHVFALDLFLGNFDRHENNWGFHKTSHGYVPAPLFDFGSCLSPKYIDGVPDGLNLEHDLVYNTRCAIKYQGTKKKNYFELISLYKNNKWLHEALVDLCYKVDSVDLGNIIKVVQVYDRSAEDYLNYVQEALKLRRRLLEEYI